MGTLWDNRTGGRKAAQYIGDAILPKGELFYDML